LAEVRVVYAGEFILVAMKNESLLKEPDVEGPLSFCSDV
jgi:hypothetical protein